EPLSHAVIPLGLGGRIDVPSRRRLRAPPPLRRGRRPAFSERAVEWRRGHALAGARRPAIDGAGSPVIRPERVSVLARRSGGLRSGRPEPRRRARVVAALAPARHVDLAPARPPRRSPALAD